MVSWRHQTQMMGLAYLGGGGASPEASGDGSDSLPYWKVGVEFLR